MNVVCKRHSEYDVSSTKEYEVTAVTDFELKYNKLQDEM